MDKQLEVLLREYNSDQKNPEKAASLIRLLLSLVNSSESVEYKFRNLPCSITPTRGSNLWYVSGTSTHHGSGVLEWCYDEEDAKERLSLMSQDHRFSRLAAHEME